MKSQTPALDRGIDVVELLASSETPMSFSEIMARLQIPRASLSRILNTLHTRGVIDKLGKEGHYRLGMKLLYFGHRLQDTIRLRSVAWPIMGLVRRELNETVELSIIDRDQLVLIEQVEGPGEVKISHRIGSAYPYFHAVSAGKVYLAAMEENRRNRILDTLGLPPVTQWTITDRQDLERELVSITRLGYAVEDQELMTGVRRVAAGITDHSSIVKGALSVAAPIFRMDISDFHIIGPKVKRAADRISGQLGAKTGHI
jgi:DNA-binding IclR family transcriptional regulator